MPARTFINQQGTSNKFWTIEVSGAEHTVHYGRLGTDGQVKTKAFADAAKAAASAEKLIAEKLAKGYSEEGTATPPPAERVGRAGGGDDRRGGRRTPPPQPVAAPSPPAPRRRSRPRGRALVRRRAVAAAARRRAPSLRSGIDLRPDEWALGGVAARARRARSGGAVRPQAGGRGHPQGEVVALRAGNGSWRELPFDGHAHARRPRAWLRYPPRARNSPTRATAARCRAQRRGDPRQAGAERPTPALGGAVPAARPASRCPR